MTPLDERRTSNLTLVATLARVECPDSWGSKEVAPGVWRHVPTCARCHGTGTLPSEVGVKYELAETVACERCGGLGYFRPVNVSDRVGCAACGGKPGRGLRPVDLEEEVSVAEACGRLRLVLHAMIDASSPYIHAVEYEEFNSALNALRLPAAEDAIGELLAAMQAQEGTG